MGAQPADPSLTENGGGLAPAGAPLYVGIDVGRRYHLVAAIPRPRMGDGSWERTGVRRVATNAHGYAELTAWLAGFGLAAPEVQIAIEPTGGWYARTIVRWLETAGYTVSWLHNWAVHERRQLAIGKQTKTDALDARLMARLLYERECLGSPHGFLHQAPRSREALRLLVRNRAKLVEQRTRYRLQLTAIEDVLFPELKDFFTASISGPAARCLLEAFPTPAAVAAAEPSAVYTALVRQGHARRHATRVPELQALATTSAGVVDDLPPVLAAQAWLLGQLRRVDDQIDSVEAATGAALASWPARDRAILNSFPGMTDLRQAVLLATMGDVTRFQTDRQLRKLLGWYPEAKESGTSLAKHHLGQSGSRMARRELWLWVMFLLSPPAPATAFRTYYQQLRHRGVGGRTAVGHVAGKVISVLFFCLRHGQPYDIDRHVHDLGRGADSPGAEARPLLTVERIATDRRGQ